MNDFQVFVGFLVGLVAGALVFSAVLNFTGAQSFREIKQKCEQRGYIQNADTRIYCQVEKGGVK